MQQEAVEKGAWFRRWFGGKGRGAAGAANAAARGEGKASDSASRGSGNGDGQAGATAAEGAETTQQDAAATGTCSPEQAGGNATQEPKQAQKEVPEQRAQGEGGAHGGLAGAAAGSAGAHRQDSKLVYLGAPPQGWEVLRKKLNMSELEMVDWNASLAGGGLGAGGPAAGAGAGGTALSRPGLGAALGDGGLAWGGRGGGAGASARPMAQNLYSSPPTWAAPGPCAHSSPLRKLLALPHDAPTAHCPSARLPLRPYPCSRAHG